MKFKFTGQEMESAVKVCKRSKKPIDLKKIDNKRYKVKK